MPNIEELLRAIVTPLVTHPEKVEIEIVDTEEYMEYHLHVDPEDVGRLIGRNGRVANAIRTILYSVRTEENRRVRLVIEDGHHNNDEQE